MPKHNRREKMANKLLNRGGSVSMKEILTASYGTWPPQGLNIDPNVTHDRQIKLVLVNDEEMTIRGIKSAGWVYTDDNKIHLNELLENFGCIVSRDQLLNTVIGHEATHLLQGGSGYHNIKRINLLTERVQRFDRLFPEKGRLRESFNAKRKKIAVTRARYFAKGIEVQARLHQILAEGYQKWRRMPQNRNELWMAFSCFGFKPPTKVGDILQTVSAADPSLKDFKKSLNTSHSAAMGIQSFYDPLSAPAKQKFWEETLPELYVSLAWLYGAKPDRKAFGLKKSAPSVRKPRFKSPWRIA